MLVATEELGEFMVGTLLQQDASRCYHEYFQKHTIHTGTVQLLEPPYTAVRPLQEFRRFHGVTVSSSVAVQVQKKIENLESATQAGVLCSEQCSNSEADEILGCRMFGIRMTSSTRAICQIWRPGEHQVDIRGELGGFFMYFHREMEIVEH
jgi:hypothetical protein